MNVFEKAEKVDKQAFEEEKKNIESGDEQVPE